MTAEKTQDYRRYPAEFTEGRRFGLPPEMARRPAFSIPDILDRLAKETAASWKWNDKAADECDLSKVSAKDAFYAIAACILVAANEVCRVSKGRARRDEGVWQLAVSQDNEQYLYTLNSFGVSIKEWVKSQYPGIKIPIDPSVSRRVEVSWISPDRCTVFSVPVTLEPLEMETP